MITNRSQGLGNLLEQEEFGCDFLLLKYEAPLQSVKFDADSTSSDVKMPQENVFIKKDTHITNKELLNRQLAVITEKKEDLE